MLITFFGLTFISVVDAKREGGPRKTHTERTRMKYGKPYNRACDRVITESGDGIFFFFIAC